MFRTIGDLLFVFNLDPLWQPLFQGVVLLLAVCLGSARLLPGPQPARALRMSERRANRTVRARCMRRIDPAVVIAFGCIVVLLLLGASIRAASCRPNICCSS